MGKGIGKSRRLEHELDLGLVQEIKLTSKNVTVKAMVKARARGRIRSSVSSRFTQLGAVNYWLALARPISMFVLGG